MSEIGLWSFLEPSESVEASEDNFVSQLVKLARMTLPVSTLRPPHGTAWEECAAGLFSVGLWERFRVGIYSFVSTPFISEIDPTASVRKRSDPGCDSVLLLLMDFSLISLVVTPWRISLGVCSWWCPILESCPIGRMERSLKKVSDSRFLSDRENGEILEEGFW